MLTLLFSIPCCTGSENSSLPSTQTAVLHQITTVSTEDCPSVDQWLSRILVTGYSSAHSEKPGHFSSETQDIFHAKQILYHWATTLALLKADCSFFHFMFLPSTLIAFSDFHITCELLHIADILCGFMFAEKAILSHHPLWKEVSLFQNQG